MFIWNILCVYLDGPAHGHLLLFIAYALKPTINAHAGVSSGGSCSGSCIHFGLSLHLHLVCTLCVRAAKDQASLRKLA